MTVRAQIIPTDKSPLIMLVCFDLELPNLARFHKWQRSVFLRDEPYLHNGPHTTGKGSSIPKLLGLPTRAQTV